MENLLKSQKSLMISSLSKNSNPEVSYAPFIMKNNKLYIYISKAANHYFNLLENNKCSVMIIEDENESKSIFARQRVSFSCEVEIKQDDANYILDEFEKIHGSQIIMVLKSLDFDVFELNIKSGRLVKGFGQAFDIEIIDEEFVLNQVNGGGHK
ncbi:HugZ family protein [Paraclostridium bifermentans]|uniref:HugZ family pyridoxamine 5'-phosphate oxidase n=1 Tax=Paraclostridium bifermentans TaxID=1490 RepID=UPI001C7E646F|nr:pyridoxamine 5'-phosphate oxidase family protein [Paraclostridium bifermentans]GIM30872.1 heme utilization protein HutZ [Paraclostridium bifermentans subsp. muricolitidis]